MWAYLMHLPLPVLPTNANLPRDLGALSMGASNQLARAMVSWSSSTSLCSDRKDAKVLAIT